MKKVLIFGSTGSIGRQTLDVLKKYRARFQVIGLSYHTNHELFKQQIKEFQPEYKICTGVYRNFRINSIDQIKEIVEGQHWILPKRLYAVLQEADIVINAISGSAGLPYTVAAIQEKKRIFLANKESIILGGVSLIKLSKQEGAEIIPLDSEHHAIKQMLESRQVPIRTVYLTCSGGPFYGKSEQELRSATLKETLQHPTWHMGQKISIDSATLMNKGFEIIEAMHLFNLKPEQIKIKIEPQSRIHAVATFEDNVTLAKIAPPDMRIVIEETLTGKIKYRPQLFDFEKSPYPLCDLRPTSLKGIELGYAAAIKGESMPMRLCLVNEYAVNKFLTGDIKFLEIYSFLESVISDMETLTLLATSANVQALEIASRY